MVTGLFLEVNGGSLIRWVDADGRQEEDQRAYTGYAFWIDGGTVL